MIKMNKKYTLIPIMLVVMLLAACGGGETGRTSSGSGPA
jgi:hypothetical protein